MSEQESMQLARQLMLGLSLLHELDYVHRNIKPENITFQWDGTLVVGCVGGRRPGWFSQFSPRPALSRSPALGWL